MPFLPPNQQHQSTEGTQVQYYKNALNISKATSLLYEKSH